MTEPSPGFLANIQKKHTTKKSQVLNHLKVIGNISSLEAIDLFLATRLADIIFKLKKENHKIESVDEYTATSKYTRYFYHGQEAPVVDNKIFP
jgi:ribosomal protein S8